MKKRMILVLGLSLLIVGCLGFLGCGGSGYAPTAQSTPTLTMFETPDAQAPTATAIASAAVLPAGTAIPAAQLGQMTFVAPSGYQLSAPDGAVITFSNNLTGTLPIAADPSGNGNLVTTGVAELPSGTVSMTFPTLTLGPANRTRAQSGTLTLIGLTVNFTVGNASWTMPSSTYFNVSRQADGFYEINGSLATAMWNSNPPAGCTLQGLKLYNSGNLVNTLATHEYSTVGNAINITGSSSVEFDAMAGAVFTFLP